MSFNLTDLIKDQLTEQVTGYLGGLLGGNSKQNSLAIDSAIPGLLGGLMHAGNSSPEIADSLFGAIKDQDDGILDNLGDLLGGKGQSTLIDTGSNVLGSLLGNKGVGSLVSSIAGFSGVGKGSVKSLLGLLAPIVFGVIKRKLMGGGDGFNVGSLMNMFKSQKDNITASMPEGFEQRLKEAGFVDDFASKAVNTARDVAGTAQQTANEGKSFLSKLVPLALLVGALLFAYNYFIKDKGAASEDAARNTISEKIDVGRELTGTLSSVTASLGSITDVKSAKAVLPSLGEATAKLGNLAGMLDKMPESARGSVIKVVSDAIPQLRALIDKVGAIPGVGPIIKPAVEQLVAKLSLFK